MDYYLGSSSIIEQTSTDTEGQLLQFMEFLEQANLGVEFYESSSTDFSDPVKIEVENNQIKRTPCDD